MFKNIDPKLLIDYSKNAKNHPKEQLEKLVRSFKEEGFHGAIIVDENNVIIAGHGRKHAAILAGLETVPIQVLEGLSEEQKRSKRLGDNKLAESDWLGNFLKDELIFLKEANYDVTLSGFDLSFLGETEAPNMNDPDECPDIDQVELRCELGDIWQLGEHRLMCGDSMDILTVEKLMDNQKADIVFTDPPYGYKYESNFQKKHEMLKNDDIILDFLPTCFLSMENNSAIYLCTSHQVIDKWKPVLESNFKYKNMIIWKKNNWSMGDLKGSFAGQHEIILFGHKGNVSLEGKRDSDIWEFPRVKPDLHPTMKPVELIEYAISKVTCNRVLDLFGGSGSTLIACEKTNRKCFMMELDPRYASVIIERWEKYTGKIGVKLGS